MIRDLKKLNNTNYDVLIIGGGIFGACMLWEAAHRGLSACLIERGDFCEATSANHFKMVHGGIRYIQHGDLVRLRESSVERSVFLRIAPHLVTPLPVLIPTYGHGMKGKEILKAGVFFYDLLTADRNYKIYDSKRKIPSCYSLSKEEVLRLFPGVKQENLTGGVIFTDAQMYNPARLVLSFIKSAFEKGADAANYVEAEELLIQNNICTGVKVKDRFSTDCFEVHGKIVINTTGPWSNNFLNKSGIKLKIKPSFSRDTAFVLNRKPANGIALATTLKTKDPDTIIDRGGRHIFIAPWIDRNKLMVGVWHIVWDKTEDKVFISKDEIEEFISEINEAYPDLELSIDDIALINTGLTLFGESTPGSKRMSFGKRSLFVDHKISHKIEGLLTLVGVRATMGRAMAEKVISVAFGKLNLKFRPSNSKFMTLYGGDLQSFDSSFEKIKLQMKEKINEETLKSLLHKYGSRYTDVLKSIQLNSKRLETIGNSNVIKAEIIYNIKNEMAFKLKDIILRRTDLGNAGFPGRQSLETCAEIMSGELKWSESKKQSEIAEAEDYYTSRGSIKLYNTRFSFVD